MNALKRALVIVGVILLLMGIVFALQGDGVIGGSALMSGNTTYIYVGAAVAILGLILIFAGTRRPGTTSQAQPAANTT